MNLVDKIFKIGVLVVAAGFLAVYGYSRRHPAHSNQPPCGRYVLGVANGAGPYHTIYEVDTQEGTVYYADRSLLSRADPINWSATNPREAAKK